MKIASYWAADEQGRIRCQLCPHGCVMAEGQTGRCHVRGVRDGKLWALGYGMIASAHVDPMEKKPLYHFKPRTFIYSVGGWGCNLSCRFCQNSAISQVFQADGPVREPEEVVRCALASGTPSIAYTYNEPWVGIEFVHDCCVAARAAGLANVLVTNGYVNPAPAAVVLPWIDALNLDIKSMDDAFYQRLCGAHVAPVLAFARQAVQARCHVEITNLLVTGENDTDDHVVRLAEWIHEHLGPDVPLHLSAYFPRYRFHAPPTDPARVLSACRLAKQHLRHVHGGNI